MYIAHLNTESHMKKTLFSILIAWLLISGCASFGRGVAEAIMKPTVKNYGECRVFTRGFDGIKDIMAKNNGKVKIMTIHGIGKRAPGYSESIASTFAYELGLNATEKYKNIVLQSTEDTNKDLGHLRIYKYNDKAGTKELILYEYTWTSITETTKHDLAYDNYNLNAEQRTEINKKIKTFINDTVIDPLYILATLRLRKIY